jgi:2-desacetyl-2-hydroxyethyl bacteriochlorophyllide A dehydrogenase
VTSGTAVDAATFVVLPGVDEPLRLESRPVPRPAPGQALVRVEACGVCGSDLFLQEGGFGAGKLPVVPGHEAAGRVVAVGDAADEALVGRQVALYYIDAPPTSRWAVAGHGNVGPDVQRMGVDVDGALADFVVRPVSTLVVVDPAMDPASVAVATDALATPWHALVTVARVLPQETVAVIGLGGVGSNAVQIAKHLGARVVAVGRGAAKLALAGRLGADALVRSADGPAAVVDAAHGQVDVVLQCTSDAGMDRLAVEVAGYRGRVVLVGASLSSFSVAATELIWRELALLGSRGHTRQDIEAVLQLVRTGALRTEHLTEHQRPLREAAAAFDDLRHHRVLRTVLRTGEPT